MFGFSKHRKAQLTEELRRIAPELARLGVERVWLAGDLIEERVTPESQLELVLVHPTREPFHRRSDFFVTHLRPTVGTQFVVYTPEEFDTLQDRDDILVRARRSGGELHDE
jgi:hypothetical protein